MRRLVLALALALSPLAFVAAPAHATGATLTIPAGILFPCEQHPYSYALDLPPGTTSALLNLQITGADGLNAGGDIELPSNINGSGSFQLCSHVTGSYTMSGTVTAYRSNGTSTDYPVAPVSFFMRQPMTQTVVTANPKKPKPGQTVKFKVTSLVERPTGFFPVGYADVRMEEKFGGWKTIRKTKTTTNSAGVATIKVQYVGGKFLARAAQDASTDGDASVSKPIKLH